jgi:transcriptional regulator with XRE-family HTH domain
MRSLGLFIRNVRQQLEAQHTGYSLRAVAKRIGIQHSYLSKLERGEYAPLKERRIRALADDLGIDENILFALSGKIPPRHQNIIEAQPEAYIQAINNLIAEEGALRNIKEKYVSTELEILTHRMRELSEVNRRLRDDINSYREKLYKQPVHAFNGYQFTKDVCNFLVCFSINESFAVDSMHVNFQENVEAKGSHSKHCYNLLKCFCPPCSNCPVKKVFENRTNIFFQHHYNGVGDCIALAQPTVTLEDGSIKAMITVLKPEGPERFGKAPTKRSSPM